MLLTRSEWHIIVKNRSYGHILKGEIMEAAAKIKQHIKRNGLKQRWVAEQAGMTDTELSEYLRGKRRITIDAYIRICDALGVPLETFRERSA